MKYINRILSIIISLYLLILSSCQSNIVELPFSSNLISVLSLANSQIIADTGSPYNNYITIKAEQLANIIDRNNSYKIGVYAKFTANGSVVNAGPLYINSRTIMPGTGNLYQYNYQNTTLAEGKSLFGTSVQADIPGISEPATSSPQTSRYIVLPKEIFPTSLPLPKSEVDRTLDYPLTWNADPTNQYHQVQITVSYYKSISQYNAVNMPNSIANLYYTVADNGYFLIPKVDLARFPKGAYVSISIARASYISSTNRVVYIGIVEAHTIPLLVIDNTNCNFSISGNSSLCSGTSNYTLTGVPIGANVSWVSSNTSVATVTTNNNPATVTKVGNGNISLTATYACGPSNVTVSTQISVGTATNYYISNIYVYPYPPAIDVYTSSTGLQQTVTSWSIDVDGNTSRSGSGYPPAVTTADGGTSCGNHTVTLTTYNSCGSYSSSSSFYRSSGCYGYSISPNPANSNVIITDAGTNSNIKKGNGKIMITVYDQADRPLKQFNFTRSTKYSFTIADLLPGTYIVQIDDGKNTSKLKLVKK